MSKPSKKVNTPAQKAPEVQVSGAGEYRANCAFALKLERIERGAVVTLTAEEAIALGDKVSSIAPVQPMSEVGAGGNKEQGQAGASNKDATDGSTASDASGSEAANQDQTV